MLLTTGAVDEEILAGDCGGLDGFELPRTQNGNYTLKLTDSFQIESNDELTLTRNFLNRIRSSL